MLMSSYLVNRGLRISAGSGKKSCFIVRHGYWIELQWDPRVSGPSCVSLRNLDVAEAYLYETPITTDEYRQVGKLTIARWQSPTYKPDMFMTQRFQPFQVTFSALSGKCFTSHKLPFLFSGCGALGHFGGLKQYQWQSQPWCSTIARSKIQFEVSAKDAMVNATNLPYPIIPNHTKQCAKGAISPSFHCQIWSPA